MLNKNELNDKKEMEWIPTTANAKYLFGLYRGQMWVTNLKLDYWKYNHTMTPIAAADPDVVFMLEHTMIAPDNL